MPTIHNKYQYTLTDRLGNFIPTPLGERNLVIGYAPEDGFRAEVAVRMTGKITFTKADYDRLLSIEKTSYRCSEILINVYKKDCLGAWVLLFPGIMQLNEGEWNLDGCTVTLPIQNNDKYACLENVYEQEVNFFEATSDRKVVRLRDPRVTLESVTFNVVNCANRFPWGGPGPSAESQGYVLTSYAIDTGFITDPPPGTQTCEGTVTYTREAITVPNSEQMETSWMNIGPGAEPGTTKYVRPAKTFACETSSYGDTDNGAGSYYKSCSIIGSTGPNALAQIDNGVRLYDLLTFLVKRGCPTYGVKSDFFQFNPDVVTNINYVTAKASTTSNVIVYQKSDVKRPNDLNNASAETTTLKEVVEALCEMFNLQYMVDGNFLRIEHVSFFNRTVGMDLTATKYRKYINGLRQYTYDKAAIPRTETYAFMEAKGLDFVGKNIEYNSACATTSKQGGKKEHKVPRITTDMEFVLNNYDSESKLVDDHGFVYVSASLSGGVYYVNSEQAILSTTSQLNNSFGWALLHDRFHRHYRPLLVGNMNNAATTFASVIPSKKGQKLVVPICCDDVFDPYKLVRTPLGDGVVNSANINLGNETLELVLSYDPEAGVSQRLPPTANPETVNGYLETPIFIRVVDNDVNTGTAPLVVEITFAPSNGTAVVFPISGDAGYIRYTPNPGFVGNDAFIYRVIDSYNEPSAPAVVTIHVRQTNTSPTTAPDNYTVNKNTSLNILPAGGVFVNDSDDYTYPLVLVGYDATTTQGGTVAMDAQGGFVYNPATGYHGTDTFTYTVKDDAGLIATGTVTISVNNPTGANAINDSYNILINTSTAVGAGAGVLANDTTPNGPLSVPGTPYTAPTSAGGSITMNANGSFTYMPLIGYTGLDSFVYNVIDAVGETDTALIEFHIAAHVYVRMSAIGEISEALTKDCGSGVVGAGEKVRKDFVLNYYSDPAGTTPLNVSGFNVTININENVQNDVTGTNTNTELHYNANAGTSAVAFAGFITLWQQTDCTEAYITNLTTSLALLPGTGYTVI